MLVSKQKLSAYFFQLNIQVSPSQNKQDFFPFCFTDKEINIQNHRSKLHIK